MKLREDRTAVGWQGYDLFEWVSAEDFVRLARWMQASLGPELINQVNDPLGDSAYWDFRFGGHENAVLTLHFHHLSGVCLFAHDQRGETLLQALRPLLERTPAATIRQAAL